MKPILHVLPNPSGITNLAWRMDPFGMAVHKFIVGMSKLGYELVHYGHESSNVPCEHVTVVTNQDLQPPDYATLLLHNDKLASIWTQNTKPILEQRVGNGDIVLCFYGNANQAAVSGLKKGTIVEPSIGYTPVGVFSDYRVFVSYAQMHYFYGIKGMILSPSWYDAVIPNAITPDEFDYSDSKDDYLLYVGRISPDKGIDLAIQLAKHTNHRIVIAGPGDLHHLGYNNVPEHVTFVGYADAVTRRKLMKHAKALLAPTHYVEPFGNIVAESLMSGTPVITSDWGGFVDNNQHGVTGFRCRDFQGFVDAVNNISDISHQACRDFAMANFSDDVVHDKFDRYIQKLSIRDFYHVKNIQP